MNKEGQGRPEGAPTLKEQERTKNPSEAGKDYRDALSPIRADQELNTFVADLRQNKEQLLSFARKLQSGKIRPSKTEEEAKDNIALGLYIDLTLRVVSNPDISNTCHLFSNSPADWPDENSAKPLSDAERREILAEWAVKRVASKWLDTHPNSEAANVLVEWGAYAFHYIHPELLQEMWPSIRDIASQSEKKK